MELSNKRVRTKTVTAAANKHDDTTITIETYDVRFDTYHGLITLKKRTFSDDPTHVYYTFIGPFYRLNINCNTERHMMHRPYTQIDAQDRHMPSIDSRVNTDDADNTDNTDEDNNTDDDNKYEMVVSTVSYSTKFNAAETRLLADNFTLAANALHWMNEATEAIYETL